MLLFRSEEHIDAWCRGRDLPRGGTMTPAQGWRLAQIWYGDKLSPHWRRKSLDEAEAIFAELGLVGEFWKLRA
jgi:hypothetical protein